MPTEKRVIALGFFDGVHKGHGALLELCVRRARELGATSGAFTFDVHPASFITGSETPLLSSPADRAELMRRCYGIEDVIIGHYNQQMMHTGWREFVQQLLIEEYHAVHLVAGHDYHFGYKGEGNPQRLHQLCSELGIGCDIIPRVEQDGITISSTYIRTLIAQGEMAQAVRFLGHPHVLTGTVSHGRGLGSTLGFPTVNLQVPAGVIVPAFGVYAAKVWVCPDYPDHHPYLPGDGPYTAVTNVGVRPTVKDNDGRVMVEGFILNFDGDLYGRTVRMEFYDYLRPEKKFDTLEQLRTEVMHNARQTEIFFAQDHHL